MKNKWERFEPFMQGVFFRVSFAVFCALFIGVFVYAYYTEQQRGEIGDSAPFAEQTAMIEDSVTDIESDAVTKAHRTRREMGIWIVESVSELLNLDQGNVRAVFNAAQPYFTDAAFRQYRAYLEAESLLSNIEAGQLTLGAIVDQTPQLMNEGVIGGVYRWLYDVPVMMTHTPARGAAQTKSATLRIQLGRINDESNPDKMVIESWQMLPRR
jgi:hypothetical protein